MVAFGSGRSPTSGDREDNGVRGDANEGTGLFQPDSGLQVTNKTQGTSFTSPSHAFRSTARCDEIFVFCVSRVFSAALWDEFGSVMCVEITDIPTFCRSVASRLPANPRFPGRPGRERIGQRVAYYDASDAPDTRWALPNRIALSKLAEFAHQEEFRLVFSTTGALAFENVALRLKPAGAPPAPPASHHTSCDVDVGSLRNICRIHELGPGRPRLATEPVPDVPW